MSNDFFNDIRPLTKYTTDPQVSQPSPANGTPEPFKLRMSDPLLDISKNNTTIAPKGVWFFAILALLVLGVVLSFLWSTAYITISPKVVSLPVDITVVLSKENTAIPYETVEIEKKIQVPVENNEKVTIQEKAIGKITIYNSFSSSPQKLVKNTRFQNKEGLIFRIGAEITIPGYKTIEGKVVPGQIEVSLTADSFGEKYNIPTQTELTIPGFSGSAQFEKIYGKTIEDFKGGADGQYFKLTSNENTVSSTEKDLREKMEKEVATKIPKEYVAISGLSTVDISVPQSSLSKEEKSTGEVTGKIKQIIFKQEDLKAYLMSLNTEDTTVGTVILDPKNITGKITDTNIDEGTETITLSGFVKKEATFDENGLKNALLGKNKKDFISIIASFSENIDKAELSIKPFWVFTIPKNSEKIKIIKK